ncbi:MAG: hypothetical protein ACU0A6_06530 [Shimia sp.]|uniref:hypothetical protein n=1 Tax=Shimia sp. TaxID=1954381 RepID=UPI004059D141
MIDLSAVSEVSDFKDLVANHLRQYEFMEPIDGSDFSPFFDIEVSANESIRVHVSGNLMDLSAQDFVF